VRRQSCTWGSMAVMVAWHGVGLSRIAFPDAIPRGWALFYPFIINDPVRGGAGQRPRHAVIVDPCRPPMTTRHLWVLAQLVSSWTSTTRLRLIPADAVVQSQIWGLVKECAAGSDLGASWGSIIMRGMMGMGTEDV